MTLNLFSGKMKMRREQTKKANIITAQINKRLTNISLLINAESLNTIFSVVNGPIGEGLLSLSYKEERTHQAKRGLVLYGSIAVISIHGFLHNHSDLVFECLLGGTSYDTIRAQFQSALNNSTVSAIILDIDSYGGEVSGCFDLVDEIFNARSIKPIYAIANEMAYAGAYAIASAAEKIFLPRTGGVGSIGVLYVHMDQSNYDKKIGVKYTPIYAGSHKADFDRHAPLSSDAQKAAQDKTNMIYELFVKTVARNRGIDPQVVRNTQAGLLFGENAVSVGMADSVMPWTKVLEDLRKKAWDDKIRNTPSIK